MDQEKVAFKIFSFLGYSETLMPMSDEKQEMVKQYAEDFFWWICYCELLDFIAT